MHRSCRACELWSLQITTRQKSLHCDERLFMPQLRPQAAKNKQILLKKKKKEFWGGGRGNKTVESEQS